MKSKTLNPLQSPIPSFPHSPSNRSLSYVYPFQLVVVKLPYLAKSSSLKSKLTKGMGHNYMGEPAWPNDILYIFPIVIFGYLILVLGLSIAQPYSLVEPADPFATPLEILPEWYIFATFDILRVLPSKLLGVLSMAYVPLLFILVAFGENISKFQNPFRRPVMTSVFITSCVYSFWLSTGSLTPISEALPLL